MTKIKPATDFSGLKYVSCPDQYGYGNAACSYIQGLAADGIPVTWTPVFKGQPWLHRYLSRTEPVSEYSRLEPLCNRAISYDRVIVHAVPEYYPFWAQREKGKFLIGYTIWETDRLPAHWPDLLNQMDLIMVPTRWNHDVFKQCGVTVPIEVIPHIHIPLMEADPEPSWEIDEKVSVFYTINDWTVRKAIWKTIRCYLETFTADDPVLLIVKTSRRDFTLKNPWKAIYTTSFRVRNMERQFRKPARILLLNSHLSNRQIAALHTRGDCFVSLGHSEGWGLGAFEAAGAAKPVIITDYGGPREYLLRKHAFLVRSSKISVSDHLGGRSYTSRQHWGEPDLDQAKTFMRYVFDHPRIARSMGTKLSGFIRNTFNERVVIDQLKKVLRQSNHA